MKDYYNGSRCQDLDTFYRAVEKIGVMPNEKRLMIGGGKGVKRCCVDLDFETFQKTMTELYKGVDIQLWAHVENYSQFIRNIDSYRDQFEL